MNNEPNDTISNGLIKHQLHQLFDQQMALVIKQGWSPEEGLTLIRRALEEAAKAIPHEEIPKMSQAGVYGPLEEELRHGF